MSNTSSPTSGGDAWPVGKGCDQAGETPSNSGVGTPSDISQQSKSRSMRKDIDSGPPWPVLGKPERMLHPVFEGDTWLQLSYYAQEYVDAADPWEDRPHPARYLGKPCMSLWVLL
ncbi:hypothetical protein HG530_006169 [Fusarium avenaceum]|nr:hypothetical protein HG530_006169 [Fusarium avenaceum]